MNPSVSERKRVITVNSGPKDGRDCGVKQLSLGSISSTFFSQFLAMFDTRLATQHPGLARPGTGRSVW